MENKGLSGLERRLTELMAQNLAQIAEKCVELGVSRHIQQEMFGVMLEANRRWANFLTETYGPLPGLSQQAPSARD